MLGKLLAVVLVLFALGGALIAADERRRRARAGERRADWLKYAVMIGVLAVLLGTALGGRAWTALLLAVLALAGALELRRHVLPRFLCGAPAAAVAFVLLLAAFAHLLAGRAATWFASFALAVVLVCSTDAFSQLWGRLFGVHKLCPRLSPGKTVEGLAGGLLTAIAVACALGFLLPGTALWRLACLGALTALGAVAGDLFFSFLKRRAGIKDFSPLLPGHGGVLDRFDSLAGAAPVFYWSMTLLCR